MKRIRFTIGSLLLIILVLGVGFAALRESSDLWESGFFSLTLAVMLISILLAVHRNESRRAFWIGFALFGSTYLGLSSVPPIEPRLITTKALAFLDSKMPRQSIEPFDTLDFDPGAGIGNTPISNVSFAMGGIQTATAKLTPTWAVSMTSGKLISNWTDTSENFVRIGHSLFALLAGWLGGQLSRRFFQSSRLPVPSTLVNAELTSS
jgi:hypothetical protein